jgi:CubicO group peptidase (beta-lactamase class C family)
MDLVAALICLVTNSARDLKSFQITPARYHRRVRIFYSTLAFLFTLNCLADPVDEMVATEMAKLQIPGLALKVAQHGQEIKTAAYGFANLEWNVPATTDTVFEIGSVTKQFTAACIMLLVEQGKISLDDPINLYLKNTPASWNGITIRHLLTHTSGIKNYTALDGFELSRHLTQAQFIAQIGAVPTVFPPGEKFSYSNSGYNLLGYIVENVSGQKYWQFLSEKILGPLQMNATTNREPSRILKLRAAGYDLDKTNGLVNRDVDYTDLFSAGEIVSTVGDLMKWDAALDTEKILKNSSKEQMWTSAKLNNGKATGYGFGWFLETLNGHKLIGHPGSTSGFAAANLRFPDDGLTVVVLCNSGGDGVANQVAKAVAGICLAEKK